MRVLAVLVLLCGIAWAAPTGFDHRLHDRDVVVTGADAVACDHCHGAGGLAKPGHASCFGACHGPPPTAKTARTPICATCHSDAKPTKAFYPPYGLDPDFVVLAGHKTHAAIACTDCHATGAALDRSRGPGPPHARCKSCHDGGRAPSACVTCHQPATGTPIPPSLAVADITVDRAFSHATHATRGGGKCTTCHAAILGTDDNTLPRPRAETCATAHCHDGAAAFPVTAACTRCHQVPAPPTLRIARPTARFSHAQHATAGAPTACNACHALAKSGEVAPAGHAACATCHAAELGAREPKICGACHISTEPWRVLPTDRAPPDATEFGATLDHAHHRAPCASCHSLTTPSAQLRPPRGHVACAGCHLAGPAPHMDACDACHRRGLAAEREAQRLGAPWSTRAVFDHAAHKGACTDCHATLAGADVLALPTPTKATCAPCHDGKAAFKLTGTQCARCHPRAAADTR
ncbi:MAG TPA: cytochrome c3 family protein [Kofleriaceae bacterium]|jgi:c(7)-type cytochrome triheme protein